VRLQRAGWTLCVARAFPEVKGNSPAWLLPANNNAIRHVHSRFLFTVRYSNRDLSEAFNCFCLAPLHAKVSNAPASPSAVIFLSATNFASNK
jgi:hypothetical protein